MMFVRGSTAGFTLTLPIIGAASAGPLTAVTIVTLLPVAICFHIFIYVLNDVVDLPVDRTEIRRRDFPLVSGAIRPRTALWIALAAIPAALLYALAMDASRLALLLLLGSFLAGALYDLGGKRSAFPPLTDLVQGLAWACLLAYGAAATSAPTAGTALLAAFMILVIMLVNGLHGGLRDLANDIRCGARTTAILFGARPGPDGAPAIPPALLRYAGAIQTGMMITGVAATIQRGSDFAAHSETGAAVAVVALLLCATSSVLLIMTARRRFDPLPFRQLGALQLLVTLVVPLVMVTPNLTPAAVVLASFCFVAPLLSDQASTTAVRWLIAQLKVGRDLDATPRDR
ncbi:MAG TPA: UbiA family prenyltransferase [Propionibacteriaceae bacterium]|nr:UbiA family prenyltransferase [Propionibacteriaceae bacterium]